MKAKFGLLATFYLTVACVWLLYECGAADKEFCQDIIVTLSRRIPLEWGECVYGVKTRLDTADKVIALTFDACGSMEDSFDVDLINYLIAERIPATLFISGRWIDKNRLAFQDLSRNDLFEIENHGFMHKPCSAIGRSAYGVSGTKNVEEVIDEIEKNAEKIMMLTGRKPLLYRSGTAHYDEVAVEVVRRLGYEAVGFSILGDAGATYSKEQVKDAIVKNIFCGAIIICHMNHPESETAQGLKQAIPELKKLGYRFVKLADYRLID